MMKMDMPYLAVDAIIEYGKGKFVFVHRAFPPIGLALPGGFAKYGKTLEQSVIEEVREETNLDFRIEGMLGIYDHPGRDPRRHVVSVVFYGRGEGELRQGDDADGVGLFHLDNVPNFVFDHNRIFKDYLGVRNKYV